MSEKSADRWRTSRIALLEEDLELASRLSPVDRELARAALTVPAVRLGRGPADLRSLSEPGVLVQLLLGGWLLRRVELGGRASSVLLGPGTVLRPGDDYGLGDVLPHTISWAVVEPARVAVLDEAVMPVVVRWPALMHALMRRSFTRQYLAALLTAIRSLAHVELRLRAFMWLYAGRYGLRGPDGLVLPVRLGHQQLADLVGSQRPSVSAHLAELSARGEIVRRPDRTWLVRGTPPAELDDLRVRADGGVAGDGPISVVPDPGSGVSIL